MNNSEKNESPSKIESTNNVQSQNHFDIYKQIKANIKNIDIICKHPISADSYYCFNCKISTCPQCPNFETHKNHQIEGKLKYYKNDPSLMAEQFQDIDNIFDMNPTYLNANSIKGELKLLVDTEINSLINSLNKIKQAKMEEIDTMFNGTENSVNQLKKNVTQVKQNIQKFFEAQKQFFNLQLENNELKQEDEKEQTLSIGPIPNNDFGNMIFLMNYDMMNISNNQNKNIKNILLSIKDSSNNYTELFKEKSKSAKTEIDKLNEPFKIFFPYTTLSQEFYREIDDKIGKYNENIRSVKLHVMEAVNKAGCLDEIEKKNTLFESKQKQNIDNILNNQTETTEMNNLTSMTSKSKIKHFDATKHTIGKKSDKNTSPLKSLETKTPMPKIGNSNEVNLNSITLQKYFTYLTMEMLMKNFRHGKKNSVDSVFGDDFDEEMDIAKPIPGTNEVQIYDRKTRVITKKKVNFDKAKHKYTYFLNGNRSVVIKDRLYITGGVDKEKNESKICYVYYLKTNELKVMNDMIKSRAYHSITFLEYFKSILVVGGENNSSCELYDMYNSKWRELPDLNYPRAYSCIYLDRLTNLIYSFFGIVSDMSVANSYIDVIECLDLRRTSLGWGKIDYKNKAEMDFKNGLCRIFPIDTEKILIYGASGVRESKKKGAIYLIEKQEIVKIDNKTFNEIRIQAKTSKKLNKIIATIS